MRKLLFFLAALFLSFQPSLLGKEPEVFINNRVLAKVKDKTFSLIDVVKQMDLYAYENDPTLATSIEKKYQFYMQSWRYFLDQLINNELMIFEAEGKEVSISDGDVREAILARFGPNVQETLHSLNLTLDEAKQLVHTDLLSQKIQGYYVHAHAFHAVTPEKIREAYEAYVLKHPAHTEWKYQFVTIRTDDETLGKAVAEAAYTLIHDKHLSLNETVENLKEQYASVKLTVSREICGPDADIASHHKAILTALPVNAVSAPKEEASRGSGGGKVFRLFHLQEKKEVLPPSYAQIHSELKDSLIRRLVTTGLEEYIGKLRKKYDISEENNTLLVPTNFVPFELK